MGKKIVVIGGVACGPKVAARVKRLDPGCEVTVVEKGDEISYGACGLPFFLEGDIPDLSHLTTTPVGIPRDVNFFQAVKGVEIRVKTEAIAIDRYKKVVKVRGVDSGQEEDLAYDKLVIATGSWPVRPPIPGVDLDGIYSLKTLKDGSAFKKAMDTSSTRRAVVVGAGLIGMECLGTLVKEGFEVHLVEKLPHVLPVLLDEEMAMPLQAHLKVKGVELHLGDGVVRFEGDPKGRVSRIITENGAIEADLVLLAIGVRPNVELARKAGLEIGRFGIKVDAYLRTSDPHIFAGGDCVENYNIVSGRPVYSPMGSVANKHGRIIANNIAGLKTAFQGVCGTCICGIMGFNVARTGLTEREARSLGMETITALNPGPDRPHYMRGSKLIHVKLIVEAYTGKVLGAQVLGPGEVLSKVDTVAALLHKGGTVEDLSQVDMAYAPPYTNALDNLIVAAHIIENKRDGVAQAYSPIELKAMLDSGEPPVLLDVRTPKEFEEMRLPYDSVVHIPLGKLRERANELPKDKEIVCLCKISLRGYEAAKILEGNGLDPRRIRFLDGGIVAWPYEKIVNM